MAGRLDQRVHLSPRKRLSKNVSAVKESTASGLVRSDVNKENFLFLHAYQAGFLLLHKLMDGFGDFQSVLIAHAKHLDQNRRLAVKQPLSVRLRKSVDHWRHLAKP